MKRRLVWLVECVHGYESGCSFGDCVGGTYEPVEYPSAEKVRTYFRNNLFDGDEGGLLTPPIDHHLTQIGYVVEFIFEDEFGKEAE